MDLGRVWYSSIAMRRATPFLLAALLSACLDFDQFGTPDGTTTQGGGGAGAGAAGGTGGTGAGGATTTDGGGGATSTGGAGGGGAPPTLGPCLPGEVLADSFDGGAELPW